MNKIYKLKFDKRLNELIVVSEITSGMGKEKNTGQIAALSDICTYRKLLGILMPLALLTGLISGFLPSMVFAADLPTGGQIVGGQGYISSSGSQMTIHQQTQNMATNWHSFDIGKNNTVQFVQPDSSSVALNRVTGASGSQIMGTLKANGQVFILNPNGVLFGKDARVNVAGLVASTKNIDTADFMKGGYTLSGEGNSGSQVINQGSLTTSKGGYIVLAGERVSNSGSITSPAGKIVLAGGKTVTLQLDHGGLTSVSVNGSVVNTLVENRGLISATDGQVYLTAKGQNMLLNTVVNNSGTIEAKGLENRGGEIVLNGGDSGVVSQSGQLLTDSRTGQGGKITLEGQNIHLMASSRISATGKTGGGEVYVGGGWQGKDKRIKNASKVVMDKSATVDVSATETGNGGTAVLWSDDYTNFRGTILAQAGAQSGNGGRVETSSHHNLQAFGDVDASARAGHGGDWLLDPTDVTIVGAGSDGGIDSSAIAGTIIFTPTASGAQILNTSIVNQLNSGTNVTIKTSGTDTAGQTGNITVNADIVKTKGADATLTLQADNNIVTKSGTSPLNNDGIYITATGTGKLNLNLLAANSSDGLSRISLGSYIDISLNGGDFYAGPGNPGKNVSMVFTNNGRIVGGNVTMDVSRGLSGYAYSILADNDLTVNGPVSGNTGWGATTTFSAGNVLTLNATQGNINLTATDPGNGGSGLLLSGGNGVNIHAAAGNVSLISSADARTNAKIISGKGISLLSSGNMNLRYLNIEGNSQEGPGIFIDAQSGAVNLNNNTITGVSMNGNGVQISGQNITISDNTLEGTSEGGAGVSIIGDTGTISGNAAVTGQSINGSGVIIAGNLSVNDNATLTGLSSGNGSGVSVAGNLRSNNGVIINGVATTGDGIKVAGDTVLTNIILSGSSDSGSGVNIARDLTTDADTLVTGTAVDGSGVSLGASLRGANVSGVSDSGTGITLADNASVMLTTLNGVSSSGSGMAVTGSVQLDDVTAQNLRAESISGNGLLLDNNSDISVVTTVGPVTSPVILGGTSNTGNGIAITGDVSVRGIILNGMASSDDGVGVMLGGNLNIADAMSGITASTTNNGTALVLNDATINATGYTSENKDFILNATASGELGTAVVISGKNTLNNVVLNASATGNGSAVVVDGELTTDKNIVATTQGDKGTALDLRGGHLQSSAPENMVTVTATATGDNAKAVVVTNAPDGTPGGTLSHITLNATAAKGNAVQVEGVLNTDNVTLRADATDTGTALNLNGGTIHSWGDTTMIATADNGQAVRITNGRLTGEVSGVLNITATTSGSQPALIINGNSEMTNSIISGVSTGEGNAVEIGGEVTSGGGGTIHGKTVNGTAVMVEDGSSLTSSTLNGLVINASAIGDKGTGISLGDATLTGSQVNASATRGDAVQIASGNVIGGNIHGHAGKGTGLNIRGDSVLKDVSALGTTESGVGALVSGNLTANGDTLLTGSALQDDGAGVVVFDGVVNGGRIEGYATDGHAVEVNGGTLNTTMVSGHATTGIGLYSVGNVSLTNTGLSGTTETGTGVVVEGTLRSDISSIITGTATQDGGAGFLINGMVVGGQVVGHSTSGDAVIVENGSVIDSGNITGSSMTGTGLNVRAGSRVVDSVLRGNSSTGTGTQWSKDAFNHNVNIGGHSDSGSGVYLEFDTVLSDAVVSGSTDSGKGVDVEGHLSNIGDTTLSGTSTGTGVGVNLFGDVSGGRINGISTGLGTGLAVSGSDVTVIDSTLIGNTVDGKGVDVTGNLESVGSTSVTGISTGTGSGVDLAGNIIGGTVSANANSSGTGIYVSGDNVTVTDSTLIGNTVDGKGVAVTGGLKSVGSTTVTGSAAGTGSGVTLGGELTGATIRGISAQGSGLQLADNAVVTDSSLKGESTDGSGVAVTGNISLDGVTATGLSAMSVNGAGLSLENNSNISIVDISTVTQEKKDQDGNTVTDGTGHPVMETVTTKSPVSIPVSLTGTSLNGSGVVTSGSVSISGMVLNGSGVSQGSTGVTLGGNLTIADNLSGISANATNGTALVLDNVAINADGYNSTGKEFVIDTSIRESGATAIKTQGNNQLGGITLNGMAYNGGTAVVLGGAVTEGKITGVSTTGDAVRITDGAQISDMVVFGTSQDGAGIRMEGLVSVIRSQLTARSANGTDLVISGILSHDPDTTIDAETTTIQDNVYEDKPLPTPPETGNGVSAGVSIIRQATLNAQVSHRGKTQLDGFHSAGIPVVPVRGYQAAEQMVDISLCDGDSCQSVSLDAGKPAKGNVKWPDH